METHLESFRVKNVAPTAFYLREWVTQEEEQALLSEVYSAPKPKWTQLSNRRLQNWGGTPTVRGMIAERLPDWLNPVLARVPVMPTPNHVLINEYCSGQGILPHEDGPLFHPVVATLSLGTHTVLRLMQTDRNPVAALLLEPRSLLLLRDELYTTHLHGIEEVECDVLDDSISNLDMCSGDYAKGATVYRDTRISLTIRHVPKTTTFKLFGNKIR